MAMGTSFEIDIRGMNEQVDRLEAVERKLVNVVQGLEDVISGLGWASSEYAEVRDFLLKNKQDLIQQKEDVASLKAGLVLIISIYARAEASLITYGIQSSFKKSSTMTKRILDGRDALAEDLDLYDDKGSYGGNQGALAGRMVTGAERRQCIAQVRKYHPEWDVDTIDEYFETMNSEGCVYTACINTIMMAYQGRDEAFERTFGFPRTNKDSGDLNYNLLLVDFYTSRDNHVQGVLGKDCVSLMEEIGIWTGMTVETSKYRLGSYLESHGVGIKMTEIEQGKLDIQNFQETYLGKPVTVDVRGATIYRADGGHQQYLSGHTMVVTSVAEDGRLIVSSWGEKYYLDPSEGHQTYLVYDYE